MRFCPDCRGDGREVPGHIVQTNAEGDTGRLRECRSCGVRWRTIELEACQPALTRVFAALPAIPRRDHRRASAERKILRWKEPRT